MNKSNGVFDFLSQPEHFKSQPATRIIDCIIKLIFREFRHIHLKALGTRQTLDEQNAFLTYSFQDACEYSQFSRLAIISSNFRRFYFQRMPKNSKNCD